MIEAQFDRLGAVEFERFCQALLVLQHGSAIEIWGGTGDGGRDAYVERVLNFPDVERHEEGPFIFQAKFVGSAGELGQRAVARLRKALVVERRLIEQRISNGTWVQPRHYVAMTNVRLSRAQIGRMKDALEPALQGVRIWILDRQELDVRLTAAGVDFRRSFPTLLSFRDITTAVGDALAGPARSRSLSFLASAHELAEVFVATSVYDRALDTLDENGFLMLSGPPEAGKTSIAKMIAAVYATEGWEVVECAHAADFRQAQRQDHRQLFVTDDVFGATEYDRAKAQEWASELPHILRTVGKNRRLVCTSRTAPLNEGLRTLHLQDGATSFPEPARVTVDVSLLSGEERASILYKHCSNARLNARAIDAIEEHGARLALLPSFTPYRAKLVADVLATQKPSTPLGETAAKLTLAVTDPSRVMSNAFANLGKAQHRVLVCLLDTEDLEVGAIEEAHVQHTDGDPASPDPVRETLASLEGNVLRRAAAGDRYAWAHPSWRDLVIDRVAGDAALRQRFLGRCGPAGLELATSVAGGADGRRERPFLRTHRDWRTFVQRVGELAGTGGMAVHHGLLQALASLLDQDVGDRASDFREIAGELLDIMRKRWEEDAAVVPVDVLELYYEVSLATVPLRPGPDLEPSFASHAIVVNGRFARRAIGRYDDAFAFIQLVRRYEPRALKAWRFPDCWSIGLERVRREVGKRADAGEQLASRARDQEAWKQRARAMSAELLHWRQILSRLRPQELQDDRHLVEHRLREVEDELESWLGSYATWGVSRRDYLEYLRRGGQERLSQGADDARVLRAIFSRLRDPGTA